ncbi:MAG TPA: diacylglycerol kinase family protein [Sphingomonas sp.]|uniref:diacylglycerol/lipid kinase family protein n=1 Tax=Sphingomonas sp. TaxID=28214 RepID=UPI002CF5D2BC|nr:diacylglycerol kinase family protein [Sphingomonas sp.]HMI18587.1 diacylglycerol kinase family protein [Sphingomonas sp.]
MTQPTVQLFVNPNAGSASRKRVAALVRAFEAAGARIVFGQSEVAADATHVCAVGGDGTLRHVAAAIARAGRPLALSLYPTGTVNLLARECDYRLDPAGFAARVLAGTTRTHHNGLIGTTPFFTCASVGADSYAVAALSTALKRRIGRLAYGWSFLTLLIRWPRPHLRVIHDGGEVACEAVYIAKGRLFAGPWSFAPEAALGDPLFHVVTLGRATRLLYARFLWRLVAGKSVIMLPGVTHFTCAALRIEGDAPLEADGDIVARLPVDIRIDPATLTFA